MPKYRTPDGLEEHACIDRAVLDLMVDLERQRPWAEDEIARTISTPGDVRDSLRQTYEAFGASKRKTKLAIDDALDCLDGAGLIERRGGRSIASGVARRLDELMTL